MTPSQKTIARKLGVSVSLVSRALSGTASKIGASPETVKKIREEACRLKYMPNSAALSLRGLRSLSIVAIIKDFNDPFFGGMIKSISNFASERSYSLFLSSLPKTRADLGIIKRLNPNIILICGSGIYSSDWTKDLIRTGAKCIQIGRDKKTDGLTRVFIDDKYGMELLLKHFLKSGHKDFLFTGLKTFSHKIRFRFLQTKIKSLQNKFIKLKKTRFAPAYSEIGKELNLYLETIRWKLPSAIIAGDDLAAIEAISFLKSKNISVPEMISVTGFDNIDLALKYIPPLTTAGLDVNKLIAKAFQITDGKIKQNNQIEFALKPEIFIRQSVKKTGEL